MNNFFPLARAGPLLADEPSPLRRLGNVHWGPLAAALFLSLIGLATVHSASAELPIDHLPKQAIWLVAGCIALIVVFAIDYHRLVALSAIFYGIAIALLVLVLAAGHYSGGAKSWLVFGPVFVQPSEFTKMVS